MITRPVQRWLAVALSAVLSLSIVMATASPGTTATLTAGTKYSAADSWLSVDNVWTYGPVKLSPVCTGEAWWVAQADGEGLIRYGVDYRANDCYMDKPRNPPNLNDPTRWTVTGGAGGGTSGDTCTRTGSGVVSHRQDGISARTHWKESGNVIWLGYEDDPRDEIVSPLPGLDPSVCTPSHAAVYLGDAGYEFNMELPAKPTFGSTGATCPMGTPSSVTPQEDLEREPPYDPALYTKRVLELGFQDVGIGTWRVMIVYRNGTTYTVSNMGSTTEGVVGFNLGSPGVSTFEAVDPNWQSETNIDGYGEIIGYQLVAWPAANGHYSAVTSGGPQDGRFGSTDPANCIFYVGDKLYESATDEDTPWEPLPAGSGSEVEPTPGPVEPGEDPTDEEILGPDERCEFSFDDPSTWTSGAFCGIVSVLMKILGTLLDILGALIGLPAAIVSALLDAIEFLLVPTPGIFESAMQEVSASTEGRAPFTWVTSLNNLPSYVGGGAAAQSAGGMGIAAETGGGGSSFSGGCPDWRIKVGDLDESVLCGTTFGNAMVAARPIWFALLVGAMFWPFIRSIMYSAIPITKPTPVSS